MQSDQCRGQKMRILQFIPFFKKKCLEDMFYQISFRKNYISTNLNGYILILEKKERSQAVHNRQRLCLEGIQQISLI